MIDPRRFTPHQLNALKELAVEYAETFYFLDEPGRSQSAGRMFAAMLEIATDPTSPPDCLAVREFTPLMRSGVDLADEFTQEIVLAYVLDAVRDRDRLMLLN